MVSSPANEDVLESHNGAEMMPVEEPDEYRNFYSMKRMQSVLPFCIKIARLFLTNKSVSKMINRKLTGKTS